MLWILGFMYVCYNTKGGSPTYPDAECLPGKSSFSFHSSHPEHDYPTVHRLDYMIT